MKRAALALLLAYASAAIANQADNILRTMSDANRRTAFGRMLAASGERCGEVVEAYRQGRDRQENAYWSVRCSSGLAVQVRIAPDSGGSTRIVDCGAIARTRAPACFTPF